MAAFFPADQHPDGHLALSPELREYLVARVQSAPPSADRDAALLALGAIGIDDIWELPGDPVDWDAIEAEARRQGCTVADVLYDRAGRRSQ